ncbi:MAG: universal stress protein [Myxococcota bacterium]
MQAHPSNGIRTLFCATDFSETSARALRHATVLARRHSARLVLAHVIEPLPIEPYPIPMALPVGEAELAKRAEEELVALGDALEGEGLVIETRQAVGPPGPKLVAMIARERADLVVIGTRGQTGLPHLLLGSTAEYVVRRSPAPVLTIHPEDREPVDSPRRVIVPTDLSADAEIALEAFLELLTPQDTPRVDLVFADSTPPYLDAMTHENLARSGQPDARREELVDHLAPMVGRLEAKGLGVELQIRDGGPVEVITAVAEAVGSDLIVMSTHGRSALVNFLLGRTAQRVVQRAPCPVLTVCPKRRLEAG